MARARGVPVAPLLLLLACSAPPDHGASVPDRPKRAPKRWGFVLVDTEGGGGLTRAEAEQRIFGDADTSVRSYLREVSYGVEDLAGEVIGPLAYPGRSADLCAGFTNVAHTLRPTIPGVFDQYLWYLRRPIPRCPWLGVADLGTAANPRRDSYYNASTKCVVLLQEPGHNFGMAHSSALRCTRGGTRVSMIVPGDGTCEHDEYGNVFDPMGGGDVIDGPDICLHMNGVQKAYQGWLDGCNVVKATSSGTFIIHPLAQLCAGPQLLQIPLPRPRRLRFPPSPGATLDAADIASYYVELRAPLGLDRSLQTPRVFVLAAGDLRGVGRFGNTNWLIDTTPHTPTVMDAALTVGATFSDPESDGPRFSLLSADASKAVIRVELTAGAPAGQPGAGLCADETPYRPSAPTACRSIGAR